MVAVPQVQIPDFAGTIARGQMAQQSRLQSLLAQQSFDDAQRQNAVLSEVGPALATGQGPEYDSALARLTGAGWRGAQVALPLIQDSRNRREAASFWGGGGQPAAQPAAAAAPMGAATPAVAPADLMPLLEEASRETGIPVPVLVAQIRQESNFDPNAVGRAGEVGLAQIMPATARQPGYGVPPADPAALRDPRANVLFGARYLAGRGRAAGVTDWNDPAQVDRALAAYNGGGDPNYVQNVRRFMPQQGQQQAPEGMAIPAAEQGAPSAQAPAAQQPSGINPAEMRRIEMGLASPNPIIQQQARARFQVLQLQQRGEAPRMTEVRTDEGVFLVDPTNPSRRVRVGGAPETAPRSAERFAQDRQIAEASASRSQTTVNSGDRRTDVLVADAWNSAEETVRDAGRRASLLQRAERAFENFAPGVMADRRIWLGQMARELGIRTRGTSEGEVLQQVQRNLELAATPKGQGAITDSERGLVRESVGILLRTPEGARAAVTLIRQLDDYEMQIARIYRENARRNGGAPNAVEVREEIANFVAQNQPPDVQAVIEQFSPQEQQPDPGIQADPPPRAPAPGTVQDGYRFRGGDPSRQSNWERVQ